MDVKTFNEHLNAMVRLEAMEHLRDLRVAQYPQLNSDSQGKYHKEIHKKAFPIQKVYSFDDIENIFRI